MNEMNQPTLSDLGVLAEDSEGKQDKRLLARNLITKVQTMVLGKQTKPEKEVINSHLEEVYELLIKQVIELVVAHKVI